MTLEPTRRVLLAGFSILAAGPVLGRARRPLPQVELKALEATTNGGRLGVAILDTQFGGIIGYRLDERFALCSTFKMPLAAAVLEASDQGRLNLNDVLAYTKKDIVPHAPITGRNLAKGGMSIAALAEAVQKTSDNVAANLLIKRLGGPEAVTAVWRRWGDSITRIDRYEPEMNLVGPGEMRDTTTPQAMVDLMAKIMLGDALKPASRALLTRWMIETETGAKRLRAGFPKSWKAGDKTGTMVGLKDIGNKTNDVAIAWPPGRAPVLVAGFLETPYHGDDIRAEDQRVLAEVGRIAAAWIS